MKCLVKLMDTIARNQTTLVCISKTQNELKKRTKIKLTNLVFSVQCTIIFSLIEMSLKRV